MLAVQSTTAGQSLASSRLVWENGAATDLGNLGGTGHFGGIIALNINNRGQVVANPDLPGDNAFHAFLWSRGKGMQDLGTLPGDLLGVGLSINDKSQVTGVSLDTSFNPRAYVWQNGVMTDLNTLIPADSPLFLLVACSINSDGEIVGLAVDTSTGEAHGYLATPINNY
jgi:probable HAF family extracellular repeat protein